MSQPLPVPGMPRVEFVDDVTARWTFASRERKAQDAEFRYWCGWFGFDESDQPDEAEGDTWLIRRSKENPR